MSVKRILTPQVRRAQRELITALSESVQLAIQEAGLTRAEAEGNLSAVITDVWLEAERQIIKMAPAHWRNSVCRKLRQS
jgi:hypothetical protein